MKMRFCRKILLKEEFMIEYLNELVLSAESEVLDAYPAAEIC